MRSNFCLITSFIHISQVLVEVKLETWRDIWEKLDFVEEPISRPVRITLQQIFFFFILKENRWSEAGTATQRRASGSNSFDLAGAPWTCQLIKSCLPSFQVAVCFDSSQSSALSFSLSLFLQQFIFSSLRGSTSAADNYGTRLTF